MHGMSHFHFGKSCAMHLIRFLVVAQFIATDAVPAKENSSEVPARASANTKFYDDNAFLRDAGDRQKCEIDFEIVIDAIQQSRPNRNTSNVLVVFGDEADSLGGRGECALSIDTILRLQHESGKAVLLRRMMVPVAGDESATGSNNGDGDDVPEAGIESFGTSSLINGDTENDSASFEDIPNMVTDANSSRNLDVLHADCNCSTPERMSPPPAAQANFNPFQLPISPTQPHNTASTLVNLPQTFSIVLATRLDTNFPNSAITPLLAKNPSLVKIMLFANAPPTSSSNNSFIRSECCTRPSSNNSCFGQPNDDGMNSKQFVTSTTSDETQRFASIARQMWRSNRVRNLYYVSTESKRCPTVGQPKIMAKRRNHDDTKSGCCRSDGSTEERLNHGSRAESCETRKNTRTSGASWNDEEKTNQARIPPDVCIVSDILAYDPFDSSSSLLMHQTGATVAPPGDESRPNENAGSVHLHRRSSCDSSDCRVCSTDGGVVEICDFNEFLQRANHINLQRTRLNISFFPETMAYLKRSSGYYRKQFKWWAIDSRVSERGDHLCVSGGDDCTDAYYGADVEAVKELALRMNFTPYLIGPEDGLKYGFKSADGQFTGALGDILSHRTEMLMNGFFIKHYGTNELEFTAGMYPDKLCFIVRSAKMIPEEWLILTIFTPNVWLAIIVTLLGSSTVYVELIYRVDNRRNQSAVRWTGLPRRVRASVVYQLCSNKLTMHMRFVGMMLSKPVSNLARSMAGRVFISACFMWSMVLTGTFQGLLYTVYSHPTTYANINTVDELAASNKDIAMRYQGTLNDLLDAGGDQKTFAFLKNKIIFFDTDTSVYDTLSENYELADTERLVNYQLVLMRYMRQNGISLFHVVEECPKSYIVAQMLPKNSVYFDQLNHNLLRFLGAGLYKKWFSATENIFFMENRAYQVEHSEARKLTVLGLGHLHVAFLLLAVGLALGTCMFIAEHWII